MRIAVYTHDGEFVGSLDTLQLDVPEEGVSGQLIRHSFPMKKGAMDIYRIPREDLDKVRKISSWKEAGE